MLRRGTPGGALAFLSHLKEEENENEKKQNNHHRRRRRHHHRREQEQEQHETEAVVMKEKEQFVGEIVRRADVFIRRVARTARTGGSRIIKLPDDTYRGTVVWKRVKQTLSLRQLDGILTQQQESKLWKNGSVYRGSIRYSDFSQSVMEINGRVEAIERRLAQKESSLFYLAGNQGGNVGYSVGEDGYEMIWHVERLIDCINEYLNMYAQLVERDELIIIGSKVYTDPSHTKPPPPPPPTSSSGTKSKIKGGSNSSNKKHSIRSIVANANTNIRSNGEYYVHKDWSLLSSEEHLDIIEQIAKETMDAMYELLLDIESTFPDHVVSTKAGPLKERERVKEKRDNDYDGDVLRVIDFVRCSVVVLSLSDAHDIVNCFQQQHQRRQQQQHGRQNSSDDDDNDDEEYDNFDDEYFLFTGQWELVRVKDGFEKPDNFIAGGYRDIKLNLRYRPNGHVIEVQFHLKEFYDLKVYGGGHKHYEFARTLEVDGVTDPLQLIDHDDIPWVIHVTESKLGNYVMESALFDEDNVNNNRSSNEILLDDTSCLRDRIQCLRHLARLYKSIKQWTTSIELFIKCLDLCRKYNINHDHNNNDNKMIDYVNNNKGRENITDSYYNINDYDTGKSDISAYVSSEVLVCFACCIYELWIDELINDQTDADAAAADDDDEFNNNNCLDKSSYHRRRAPCHHQHHHKQLDKSSHHQRRGLDISSHHQRRGLDISSHQQRRGLDISSHQQRRGLDISSHQQRRGLDKSSHHQLRSLDKSSHHQLRSSFTAPHRPLQQHHRIKSKCNHPKQQQQQQQQEQPLEARRHPLEVKWMKTDLVPMIDEVIRYLEKEVGLKHPTTFGARRAKVDLASIPSRTRRKLDIVSKNGITSRSCIDRLYEDLLNHQKEVLGDTHPEVLVTCHRYGTYMCDSSTTTTTTTSTALNKQQSSSSFPPETPKTSTPPPPPTTTTTNTATAAETVSTPTQSSSCNQTPITFAFVTGETCKCTKRKDGDDEGMEENKHSDVQSREEQVKRYKKGVILMLDGLEKALPRLGHQNTLFQDIVSCAHRFATACDDNELLLERCTKVAGGVIHSKRSLTLEKIDIKEKKSN